MAGRSPVLPRNRSHRSPSYNAQSEEPSDSEGETGVPRHDYNTRYNSSLSGSYISSQDDSLHHAEDQPDRSYSRSPLQSESKLRSRSTRTKGSSTASPGNQLLYPDLSLELESSMSGDGPTPTKGKGAKTSPKYESSQGGKSPEPSVKHAAPDLSRDIPEERQQDKSKNGTDLFSLFLYVVVAILVIFVVYKVVIKSPKTEANYSDNDKSAFENYLSGIEQLQKYFPQQSPRLWRTLKSSARHVLNASDPEYPVAILMASPAENFQLTKCIGQEVASLYQPSHTKSPSTVGTFDISQYKHLEDAVQKETLDRKMTKAFSDNGGKSFVILNLQVLAPEAALILHSFCDNDNAPYKDVMIIMTLHFDPGDLPRQNEAGVEGFLRNLWERGLVADKVGALLSRVANNIVVVVAEETSESYPEICQKYI